MMNSSKKTADAAASDGDESLALLNVLPVQTVAVVDHYQPTHRASPPIVSSYNDRIRPLLDAVDKLRRLKVTQEGIPLPTIVVVGDQSSGKSSVLESLAGISLPRGQGICTRVPLIMRLQHHPSSVSELRLEYRGKSVPVKESEIVEEISLATDEIAGNGKGISNAPLTLVVKKNGVPDLTMVDLPGITRVAVHGQPENIYEQISDIITEYIKPEESIILNVLSATVDFPTCESIRMSQKADKSGQRTLAVVTKSDMAPQGLLEKVTADDVNIGLGYVCVRNRIGDETYEEARVRESALFETHPLLSRIDKAMVGVPVLAQKLVLIQSAIISKCLPEIVNKINDKLNTCIHDQNKLPPRLTTFAEAMSTYMQIIGLSKESLQKIFILGDFDEYPEDKQMHSTARLHDMLNEFAKQLENQKTHSDEKFLLDEIRVLEESNGIRLTIFIAHSAFRCLMQQKIAGISDLPGLFVSKVLDHVETVVVRVLVSHAENYPQIVSSIRRAAQNMIAKMKVDFMCKVTEIVEMEKLTDYTCDPEFSSFYKKLMLRCTEFNEIMNDGHKPGLFTVEDKWMVDVAHLRDFPAAIRDEAFDMKMRMVSYWRIVLRRLVDWVALQLMLMVHKMVNKDMEMEIVKEVMGDGQNGLKLILEESPLVALKRERLKNRIKLLHSSKEVVGRVIDRVTYLDD